MTTDEVHRIYKPNCSIQILAESHIIPSIIPVCRWETGWTINRTYRVVAWLQNKSKVQPLNPETWPSICPTVVLVNSVHIRLYMHSSPTVISAALTSICLLDNYMQYCNYGSTYVNSMFNESLIRYARNLWDPIDPQAWNTNITEWGAPSELQVKQFRLKLEWGCDLR